MSDIVRYVTRMDTSTPPTTETGFNGFPFLWKWGNPSIDPHPEFYPISMPLEEATNTSASIARLHKRVKKWKLTTDAAAADVGGGTHVLSSGTLTNSSFNPTRELENIQDPAGLHGDRSYSFTVLDNGISSNAGQLLIISTGSFYVDGTDYYPNLQLTISLTVTNIRFRDSTGSDPFITGTFDGIPVKVYYETVSGGNTFSMSQFDLVPVEFWPYAAADGSAIYDTTTGAVLQDPKN